MNATRLWVYRYWHPAYRQTVCLDCAAPTREAALASAQRWIRRHNRRFARLKVPIRLQYPAHVSFMRDP